MSAQSDAGKQTEDAESPLKAEADLREILSGVSKDKKAASGSGRDVWAVIKRIDEVIVDAKDRALWTPRMLDLAVSAGYWAPEIRHGKAWNTLYLALKSVIPATHDLHSKVSAIMQNKDPVQPPPYVPEGTTAAVQSAVDGSK